MTTYYAPLDDTHVAPLPGSDMPWTQPSAPRYVPTAEQNLFSWHLSNMKTYAENVITPAETPSSPRPRIWTLPSLPLHTYNAFRATPSINIGSNNTTVKVGSDNTTVTTNSHNTNTTQSRSRNRNTAENQEASSEQRIQAAVFAIILGLGAALWSFISSDSTQKYRGLKANVDIIRADAASQQHHTHHQHFTMITNDYEQLIEFQNPFISKAMVISLGASAIFLALGAVFAAPKLITLGGAAVLLTSVALLVHFAYKKMFALSEREHAQVLVQKIDILQARLR